MILECKEKKKHTLLSYLVKLFKTQKINKLDETRLEDSRTELFYLIQ